MADRTRDAKARWADVAEVNEIADFVLAPAKRPICLARRRRDADAEE